MNTENIKRASSILLFTMFGLQACNSDNLIEAIESAETGDNKPPTVSGVSIDYVRTGKGYSFIPDANDPENDTLTFSIENKPAWASLNPDTGEVSGIPEPDDIQLYHDIIIKVSDGVHTVKLPPYTLKVLHAEIGEENIDIDPEAAVTHTASGYHVIGDAAITVGDLVTELEDAAVEFVYDNEGKLVDVEGETQLPTKISDNLSLGAGVRAIIGMYTGAEINASVDIGPESEPGIKLRDEFRYLVYFLDASAELTFTKDDGSEEPVSLGIGLGDTRTLIITDPTDPLFYYFGQIAGVAAGFGYSYNNNIPWEPLFQATSQTAFAPLEPFHGGEVYKGIFPISAFKVFDVIELTGYAVCRPTQLVDCNKPDPSSIVVNLAQAMIIDGGIDPSQQLKLGINGSAGIKFGILGNDLFEYHLLDVSTMIDIGTEREHLAMQGVIETSESVQPAWLPFRPVPDPNALMVANIFADVDTHTGEGDFAMSLYGEIDSDFPQAKMNGSIEINPQGMQMIGFIDDPQNPITVSAKVDDKQLEASIEFAYDIQSNIDQVVNDALDDAIEQANQAYNDLQNAIGNYDLALSLDGFRSQIPAIVDDTKTTLDAIPGKIYTAVYNGTLSGIKSSCVDLGITTKCADSVVDETQIAKDAANSARNSAQSTVNTRKAELDNLKTQAQQTEDGPAYRKALKTALQTVVSHSTFSQKAKVKKTVDFGVTKKTFTFYNKTLSYTVIDASTRSNLQTAANNVDNIEPSYTVKISTQQIYDAIPKQQIIEETRSGVQDGTVQLPEFRGAGYIVTRDMEQSVYVLLGNERIEIDFNPLDPVNVIDNIGSLIAEQIIQ